MSSEPVQLLVSKRSPNSTETFLRVPAVALGRCRLSLCAFAGNFIRGGGARSLGLQESFQACRKASRPAGGRFEGATEPQRATSRPSWRPAAASSPCPAWLVAVLDAPSFSPAHKGCHSSRAQPSQSTRNNPAEFAKFMQVTCH